MYEENFVTKNSCGRVDITGAVYLAKTGRVYVSTSNGYNIGDVYGKDTYKELFITHIWFSISNG